MEQTPSPDPFAIASLEALAQHYEAPSERALKKIAPRLDDTARNFIAASPFCILTTIGHNGPHATPRGDAPGFVACLEDGSLALPDRRGNNRLDGLRDIIEDPRVALLFLIPGVAEALRVGGTARITTDPALCARFVERGKAPTSVILISPREVYMQCAKSILRSRLWGDAPRPAGVPTAGQMIASHTGGMVDSAAYDATAPARLAETLY
ncbi:MAG: pyridoxamine 5'-phosphate oxidase family protein [Roseomonas sp.]|nr:pyridoxamine 5'-phosphate oxidase family protein [Roseomonas sp.]